MRKEHIMAAIVTLLTLVAALGAIRWLAPGLLGLSTDLQLVKVSKSVPAFYANIFEREESVTSDGLMLNDPELVVRGRPLLTTLPGFGPNDVLGFRNHHVPRTAEVIVIGDSQTYGNNADIESNWPAQMKSAIRPLEVELYNMSAGGWGAAQYLKALDYALRLKPRLIVVAFYTGNDALESFRLAYGSDLFADLRVDSRLSAADLPKVQFPSPQEEWFNAKFRDGYATVFTPSLRLASNAREGAAAQAGYRIMAETARRMARKAADAGVKLALTIIPTKELALSDKVAADGLLASEPYAKLVQDEQANITLLRAALEKLPAVIYIDVVTPMKNAALRGIRMYPSDTNGHPISDGYRVIGTEIARHCLPYLNRSQGLFAHAAPDGKSFRIFLFNREGVWSVPSPEFLERNGWPAQEIPNLAGNDLRFMDYVRGDIRADPARFGPGTLLGATQAQK